MCVAASWGLLFWAGVTNYSLSLENVIATVKVGIGTVTILRREGRRRHVVC